MKKEVRIVLIGDSGVGKSSLLATLVTKSFQTNIPKVVARLEVGPGSIKKVPFTTYIADTSTDPSDLLTVQQEVRSAHVVLVVYSVDASVGEKEERIEHWLEFARELNPNVPVVLVGNKVDLRPEDKLVNRHFKAELRPIMSRHKNVEMVVECSAKRELNVEEVFYYAHKAVLHPLSVLFDSTSYDLTPEALKAFTRIFRLCSGKRDGTLSDNDVQQLQVKCFGRKLSAGRLRDMKNTIAEALPHGLAESGGINLQGFLYTQVHFIQRGKQEFPWTVLRAFGYSDTLGLDDAFVNPIDFEAASWVGGSGAKGAKGSAGDGEFVCQLSAGGEAGLRHLFGLYDKDGDGVVTAAEAEALFETAPESMLNNLGVPELYGAVAQSELGAVAWGDFLAAFHLLLLLKPAVAVRYLVYLGFEPDAMLGTASSVLEVVRADDPAARRVLLVAVGGSSGAGKSALLATLLKSSSSGVVKAKDAGARAGARKYAIAPVSVADGDATVYVALAKIDGASVADGLAGAAGILARASASVVVFDPSTPASFDDAVKLQTQLAERALPSLLVATRGDTVRLDAAHPVHAHVAEHDLPPALQVSSVTGASFANVLAAVVDVAAAPASGLPRDYRSKAALPAAAAGRGFGWGWSLALVTGAVAVVGVAGAIAWGARRRRRV